MGYSEIMSQKLQRQYESSPLHGANAPYVEALYEAFLDDPGSVTSRLRGGNFSTVSATAPGRTSPMGRCRAR